MDIATKLTDLQADLRNCRQAITEKGGEISANAGFAEVAEKILEISTGSNIGTVTDKTASLIKQVPVHSISHCFVKSIGGMTYKSNNLIPFPYYANRGVGEYTQSDVTFTISEDRTVTLNGTSSATIEFTLFQGYLPAGTYTMSGINASNDTAYYMQMRYKDGNWYKNAATIDGDANRGTFTITAAEANQYYCRLNIRVASGVAFTNVKVRPMLNAGTTALPYEDYYEGLRDNKPTAIKVNGANLLDFEAALKYWKMSYTKDGDSFTISHSYGVGYNKPYKFTDNAQVCTISVSSSSTTFAAELRLWFGILKDGKFTRTGSTYFKVGKDTTFTSPSAANAIMWDYGGGTGAITTILNELRINGGTVDCGYHPYHAPITYPIPEAVQGTGRGIDTSYYDTVDFENDKQITKIGVALLKNMVWGYVSSYGFYSYSLEGNFIGNMLLCDGYTTADWGNVYSGNTDRCIAGNGNAIIISDSRYTDVASFAASLTDEKLYYALAEPTEEPLSVGFGLLPVEGGGTLEIITDNGKVIPNTVVFQTI